MFKKNKINCFVDSTSTITFLTFGAFSCIDLHGRVNEQEREILISDVPYHVLVSDHIVVTKCYYSFQFVANVMLYSIHRHDPICIRMENRFL